MAARREEMLEPMGENATAMRAMFESERGAAGIRQDLLTNKTLERLRAIVAGEVEPAAADVPDDGGESEAVADAGAAPDPETEAVADADAAPDPEASNEEQAE